MGKKLSEAADEGWTSKCGQLASKVHEWIKCMNG